jgi:uncharacterized protein (DUF697 family)/tellurite resistance protein
MRRAGSCQRAPGRAVCIILRDRRARWRAPTHSGDTSAPPHEDDSNVALTHEESIASLRLLVCMAKADGFLHEKERAVLEATFEDLEMPIDVSLQSLLDRNDAADAVMAELHSDEARKHAYTAMFALAYTDGDCSPNERELLEHARAFLRIDEILHSDLTHTFSKPLVAAAGAHSGIFESVERRAKVDSETRKCAIFSAVLGAFPFPGIAIVTDLAVAALQVGLAKDIGKLWGQEMDTAQAKGLLAAFGLGTGARIAVSNLLKVFPGWGSAVGAATSYMSSYAVGRAVDTYFAEGRGLDADALKRAYKDAKTEAKGAYEQDKRAVEQRAKAHADRVAELERRHAAGEISRDELHEQAARVEP